MNDEEIVAIKNILTLVNGSPINESLQHYIKDNDNYRANTLICYPDAKAIKAVWMDFEKLNEYKLKLLMKRHKEINRKFFLHWMNGYYRIGWKV